MQKLTNILLLIVLSFSIAHGVVLNRHQDKHCSLEEYISEFSQPVEHHDEHKGDLCDSHFMFHISFLIPESFSLFEITQEVFLHNRELFSHPYTSIENSFRPPIV